MASVAGSMRMNPDAMATRWVSALAPTSTIRAAPRSSKWVSFSVIIHHSSPWFADRPCILAPSPRVALAVVTAASGAQGLPDLGDASAATLSEHAGAHDRQPHHARGAHRPGLHRRPGNLRLHQLARPAPARRGGSARAARSISSWCRTTRINAFALVGGHIGVHTGLFTLTQNEIGAGRRGGARDRAHPAEAPGARARRAARAAQWTSLAALALAILASRSGSSQGGAGDRGRASPRRARCRSRTSSTTRASTSARPTAWASRSSSAPASIRAAWPSFFERMLRANRLNEFKGAPSYLRTHPLTTERIADMQDRIEHGRERVLSMMVAESFEYRLAQARVRATQRLALRGGQVLPQLARGQDDPAPARGRLRPRARAAARARVRRRVEDARPLREGSNVHPAFELLAGAASRPTCAATTRRSRSTARR